MCFLTDGRCEEAQADRQKGCGRAESSNHFLGANSPVSSCGSSPVSQ